MKKVLLSTFICVLISIAATAQYNKSVAKDGSGDYTTVQASIDAAPTNSTTPWVIYIKNGTYYEKVNIPSNKPFIQLIGQSVSGVTITYDDYAGKPITGGGTLGTQNSASVTINAADFTAMNITFENGFKYDSAAAAGVTGLQAVAVVINADRSAFKNCRFIGMQDTLYTKGSGNPRHYFYKCYIDGIVDFIFGSSIAIFDSSVVYPKSRTGTGSSYITAANTTTGQAFGYWFKDCKLPKNTGATLYYLGRPWNNATAGVTAANKTVYSNCQMSSSINPLGWSTWDAGTNTSVITYAEYQSKKFDGSLVDVSNRVAWSKQFTNTDTVGYNVLNVLNGWNPCSVRNDFCTYTDYEPTVANLKGTKNAGMLDLTWNTSWAMSGVTYQVYMSSDPSFTTSSMQGASITSTDDTTYNFAQQITAPAIGTTRYYMVQATKGTVTTNSAVIRISNEPNINTTTDSLKNFLQGSTAPSVAQSFIVNASNLLDSIKVVPPANFEISLDNINWANSSSYIKLTPTNNALANTTIYARLNAPSAGSYNGNIIFTTPNISSTTTKMVYVSGVTQSTPLLSFDVLQQWDLTTNNSDNPTVRATGLTATTPTLNRLNLSNGTQVAAVSAYSTLYGQAIAPSSAGDGQWTTASGGSGGNLNRTLYEQFTIKPDVNYSVRIDSLVALIGYYGSTSNTKIAVAYSKSNFATDSANVTGGRDGSGLTFSGTANGAFTTPVVVIATSNSGNTSQYAFALNVGNGVQLNAGETLTVRIYFSCGSTSAGRYAVVKTVQAKGLLPVNLPLKFTSYQLKATNEKQVENIWQTTNEINVSHFNIQRSANGKDFITVGKVNANNKASNEYSFFNSPLQEGLGVLYYRIVAVDKDGKISYSETKTINYKSKTSNLIIYPNPANSIATIESRNAKELLIIDYLGKTIKQFNNPTQLLTINCKLLTKGIYIIKAVLSNGEIKTEKLVVE